MLDLLINVKFVSAVKPQSILYPEKLSKAIQSELKIFTTTAFFISEWSF